jgi:double-stranded uracil-DNA glycosylase
VSLTDLLDPSVRIVIAGTIAAWDRAEQEHYYAAAGNQFWVLLHTSGLTPRRLDPEEDHLLLQFGIGLTDLVRTRRSEPGEPPVFDVRGFHRTIRRTGPDVVAFVSKTAASSYARAAGERLPRDYGALSWTVAGSAAFVLPGPSGANNGMPLPLRTALWRDLVDFCETL